MHKVTLLYLIGIDPPRDTHTNGDVAIAGDDIARTGEHRAGDLCASADDPGESNLHLRRPAQRRLIEPQAGPADDQRQHEHKTNPPDRLAPLRLPDRRINAQAVETRFETGSGFT